MSLLDIRPTLEQLVTGKPPEPPVDGRSLIPLLDGHAIPERTLFAIRWTETSDPPLVRRAALDRRWKYIYTEPSGHEELYDMLVDPTDQDNQFEENRQIAAGLRRQLDELDAKPVLYERAYADSESPASELEEQLRSLGYVQ